MSTMKAQRIGAAILLLGFFVFAGAFIHGALQPEKLPVGANLPGIAYRTTLGSGVLQRDSTHMTLLMYFHSNCQPCRRQLQALEDDIDDFSGERVVLLTDEDNFFTDGTMNAWPKLTQAHYVLWGVASADHIGEHFGAQITPSIYIFDTSGELIAKLTGEIKCSKILAALRKAE